MSIALMFPGQGAQFPSFLQALPDHPVVHDTLQEASELLGHNAAGLDTEEALASAVGTQIALVVAAAAFGRLCDASKIQPVAVAGMSVGAYGAAMAAGCLDLRSALTLVRRRAELMEAAFPEGTHGMAVIDGLRVGALRALLEGTNVVIANYNSATQHVLAGTIEELQLLLQRATDAGAHTAKMLRMAVASHTPELLSPSEELLQLAYQMDVAPPRIPMYSNRNARPLKTADAIRDELALNMAHPVRWDDSVTALGSLGVTLLIEAPPGHTLTRLASSILPEVCSMAAGEMRWDVVLRAALRNQT